MSSRFRLRIWTAALALLPLLGLVGPAEAGPIRLRLDDGFSGPGVVLTSSSGDSITFSGIIGAFSVNVSAGSAALAVPFPGITTGTGGGPPFFDAIGLSNLDISTSSGGTLRIILEQDDFVTAPSGSIVFSSLGDGTLSGPAGSTATFQSWANFGNLVPDLGPDLGPPATFLSPVQFLPPAGSSATPSTSFGPGPISFALSAPFNNAGTSYSLFFELEFTFTGEGRSTFGEPAAVPVPEPESLLLMTAAMPFLGVRLLRRRWVPCFRGPPIQGKTRCPGWAAKACHLGLGEFFSKDAHLLGRGLLTTPPGPTAGPHLLGRGLLTTPDRPEVSRPHPRPRVAGSEFARSRPTPMALRRVPERAIRCTD